MSDSRHSQATGLGEDELLAVRIFYKAFEGDADLLDEAVVPGWQDIPLAPHQVPGREGMKLLIAGFRAAFPDALNHRRFLRSRHAERQGKSPRELMTGQGHPHWLTLLGLGPLQPQRA